ncbi:1-aminocyclopropane-1-carboxylate deaminase/D-cysteine desulfhydrase [Pseudonocardia acaciae]|uniref:1-aminocyclopropane-1-carboxylate deaminase/D-cysteine desulfhydrase n=1 Tax=Pseudonocardia acaciae TaxID=551276 RepID=UPI000B068462|nr:pyridoxal-phosphate dependent enzyme [Pseudonocardia acaciae]
MVVVLLEDFERSLRLPSPLTELSDDRLGSVRVLMKRDDLIDPVLSGNKWRKLKYQLVDARSRGATTLLTFGGAYSNHVRAVAAAGRRFGFATIGMIRGEEQPFNDQLAAAVADGMRLHYLDRATYRAKTAPDVLDGLRQKFGDFYLVPEGGSAPLALRGCSEMIAEIQERFDLVVCPVGTGGTLAGLSAGLTGGQRALGFSVLRGAEYLDDEVAGIQVEAIGKRLDNWSINHRFHFGGFARRKSELDDFIAEFRDRHGIALDWVYVAKALYGLYACVEEGVVGSGATVVFVVTGPMTKQG